MDELAVLSKFASLPAPLDYELASELSPDFLFSDLVLSSFVPDDFAEDVLSGAPAYSPPPSPPSLASAEGAAAASALGFFEALSFFAVVDSEEVDPAAPEAGVAVYLSVGVVVADFSVPVLAVTALEGVPSDFVVVVVLGPAVDVAGSAD